MPDGEVNTAQGQTAGSITRRRIRHTARRRNQYCTRPDGEVSSEAVDRNKLPGNDNDNSIDNESGSRWAGLGW